MSDAPWRDRPVLAGEQVTLVPLQPEHAGGLLAAADDDEVFRWLPVRRPGDIGQMRALVAEMLSRDPAQLAWTQTATATGEITGFTTYYDIDPAQRTVAIGWTWLGSRFWRTGLNTEAKLLLLGRAFDDLGCVRVVWHTDVNNERSQAAIARLGATREGLLRKHKRRPDGSWRDTVLYSMLDSEWPSARERLLRR
ncbi:MAG: GNAT family protein [Aeromicrobium sp.]|uniref:GNAT family N-acetyltransferase n=1 Tax=Aeromicrobium sp. TaxID=1871063 RepID=UPI0025BCF7B5|nr:GNAT family protein [Aeromicrobium sp.]MCK5892126.1 GNAT family N-acetyltransferase [Aeromicrobium sp.]MDF1704216.1 GNAT family protein [Aeromicrobium sp.]